MFYAPSKNLNDNRRRNMYLSFVIQSQKVSSAAFHHDISSRISSICQHANTQTELNSSIKS